MQRTLISDSLKHIDEDIVIQGWVQTRRDHGKLVFLDVRDLTGLIQVVVNPQESKVAHDEAQKLRAEFVVQIAGHVRKRPKNLVNPGLLTGMLEIEVTDLMILAAAETLPFESDSPLNIDTYLDFQPIALRGPKNRAVFKIQSAIAQTFREFLQSRNFTEFQAPKIVAQAAEGGANIFQVKYFGHQAFLAQSPQLYKQIMVGIFERVFTITSVYRAEPHSTTRHLNEYVSLDLEFGFIRDHTDIMDLERDWMEYLMTYLDHHYHAELALLGVTLPKIPKQIPTFKLREVQGILKKQHGIDAIGEPDLEPEHEKLICQYATEKLDSEFVFVTHYPTSKRPFYTYPDEKNPEETKSFDLLFRGVEVTTGGQRIHDYKQLLTNIDKWGYKRENFSFYLQAFKYGMPPEGGCATGLERLTQKICGLPNIKLATLFPRDLNRIDISISKLKLDEKKEK